MKTAFPALLLAFLAIGALSYPMNLECGTDAISRLKVGGTIMGAVLADGTGGPFTISSNTTHVSVQFETMYFMFRAWGDGATLKCLATPGLNLSATTNCTSQVYLASDAPSGPITFTCQHNGATGFAIAYSGTGRLLDIVTDGPQPPGTGPLPTPASPPPSPPASTYKCNTATKTCTPGAGLFKALAGCQKHCTGTAHNPKQGHNT
jgi:hypothetical protein